MRKWILAVMVLSSMHWVAAESVLPTDSTGEVAGKNLPGHEIAIANAELAVVLAENPSSAEKRVAEIFAERAQDRSGVTLAGPGNKAKYRLVIGRKENPSLGADGYSIAVDPKKGELTVTGQSDSGVVAGMGRLMREMRYQQGKVVVPALQIAETPQMPNRGMYLWARKYYFNQPDQVDRYIEEFALWGGNALCFWFEMGMFENFQDTKGEKSELNSGYARQYKIDKSIAKDWKNLVDSLDSSKERPPWFAGFEVALAPNHGYARMSAEERDYYNKAKQPLMVFPDISMWGNHSGMLVKKAYWKIREAQAKLENSLPAWAKRDWRWAEIVECCKYRTR